jgi:hypothetical protein
MNLATALLDRLKPLILAAFMIGMIAASSL